MLQKRMRRMEANVSTSALLGLVAVYDLVDVCEACRLIGGPETPINSSTFYRSIKKGLYPRPIKVGSQKSRWRRSEILAAIERQAAQRDEAVA
jgi:predicted DNA-binding transcriptional regulator AlpA